ncbi:phosphoglycerate mutase-like protein [Exidia glandulosa HHB12029]|uniref:Phosphoglycerate mutase-like protein n=1 Tax=Exidia glandulosa HHB12029 TaxID=1314781 RepID=A0A165PRA8_EXIGL|nr:phosphoglycerate mutase-like protein [Exidia glandulosa HHB12029]
MANTPDEKSKRPVPRLFLIRHGETEWSLNGTGVSDIPLTANGEAVIKSHRECIVGPGMLLDPDNICHIYVSPRQRAQKTFELLFPGLGEIPKHSTTDIVREWDYGDYEGLTSEQIRDKNPSWDIFKDGCPGGESVQDMTKRCDQIIAFVRELHRKYFEEGIGRRDCLIVAHGHFSRCLIARWLQTPLFVGQHFQVEPAGVAMLTYNHRNLNETSLTGLNLHAF